MRKIQPEKIKGETPLDMPKEHYPRFNIDIKHLPEVKDWKIGNTYYLTLEIKQTGLSIYKNEDREDTGSADFDITGIEVVKKPNREEKI